MAFKMGDLFRWLGHLFFRREEAQSPKSSLDTEITQLDKSRQDQRSIRQSLYKDISIQLGHISAEEPTLIAAIAKAKQGFLGLSRKKFVNTTVERTQLRQQIDILRRYKEPIANLGEDAVKSWKLINEHVKGISNSLKIEDKFTKEVRTLLVRREDLERAA